MFQDLILVYWTGPKGDFSQEFGAFTEKLNRSRYIKYNLGAPKQLYIVDLIEDMLSVVRVWDKETKYPRHAGAREDRKIWIGFQGAEPGWNLPEFHDILKAMDAIPTLHPGVVVSWLPDNWFDHPGLAPQLEGPEHALAWLEHQLIGDCDD